MQLIVVHVVVLLLQVFTSVFTTECVLKLGALGTDFFRNGWNVFDFVIVLASLVDLGLEIVNGLSVLRGMRLVSRSLLSPSSLPTPTADVAPIALMFLR